MLVVEHRGRLVVRAFAFRKSQSGVRLRMIALEPSAGARRLGRRVMEAIELDATRLGVGGITLGGAGGDVKGFYRRTGYPGRGSMMSKRLAPPGRFCKSLRRLKSAAGDVVAIRRSLV